MNNAFDDERENLFRAVLPKHIFDKRKGRISSAAFKDPKGVSVDRGAGRPDKIAAKALLAHGLHGSVCAVSVLDCQSANVFINPEPSRKNSFHAALYANSKRDGMEPEQSKYLAEVARLIM